MIPPGSDKFGPREDEFDQYMDEATRLREQQKNSLMVALLVIVCAIGGVVGCLGSMWMYLSNL